ncbi:hypothetical protein CHELA1G2_20113 [Hyphomicrobiales bacterium]|nr:hypothetical protein CHELA1G2_20113 [Hyphomicrobiales bacterium]
MMKRQGFFHGRPRLFLYEIFISRRFQRSRTFMTFGAIYPAMPLLCGQCERGRRDAVWRQSRRGHGGLDMDIIFIGLTEFFFLLAYSYTWICDAL